MGLISSITKPFKSAAKWVTGAGSSLVGSIIGAGGSLLGAQMTSDSVASAQDVDRENYQNRYQWTMADMRKAGLNPIFAHNGIGGSVPGAATGNYGNVLSGMNEGANTAFRIKSAEQDLRNLKALEHKITYEGDYASARDHNQNIHNSILEQTKDWMIDAQKANAESARAMADMNKLEKSLKGRDAKFWLDHPKLRNATLLSNGFQGLLPNTGILLNPMKGKR